MTDDWMIITILVPPDADETVKFQETIIKTLVDGFHFEEYDNKWANSMGLRMEAGRSAPPQGD